MHLCSGTSPTTSTRHGDGQARRGVSGLDPTVGAETQKTRPAVIVSLDELNGALSTVVVVPLTTGRVYPFRPQTRVAGRPGVAAVDQVRTVDKRRLSRRVATLSEPALSSVLEALTELFAV